MMCFPSANENREISKVMRSHLADEPIIFCDNVKAQNRLPSKTEQSILSARCVNVSSALGTDGLPAFASVDASLSSAGIVAKAEKDLITGAIVGRNADLCMASNGRRCAEIEELSKQKNDGPAKRPAEIHVAVFEQDFNASAVTVDIGAKEDLRAASVASSSVARSIECDDWLCSELEEVSKRQEDVFATRSTESPIALKAAEVEAENDDWLETLLM